MLVVGALFAASVIPGMTPARSAATTSTSSNESASANYSSQPQTFEFSSYEPVSGLGNGVEQFEGNNLHVYNYSWGGAIAAFNESIKGSVIVPPTVYRGLLLVDISGTSDMVDMPLMNRFWGGVLAIDLETGADVWNATFPNMMMTQPLTYDGLVIVGLGNNNFVPGTAYVRGTGTNYVAALNVSTGDTVWAAVTPGEDMPTPAIYNGFVIGVNGNGMMYGLNATNGKEVWASSLPGRSYVSMSSLAIKNGAVYFGAYNPSAFYSVNASSGDILWQAPLPAVSGLDDSSPAIWGDVVVTSYEVGGSNASMRQPVLLGMSTTSGSVLWSVNETAGATPSAIENPPITIWNGIAFSDTPESSTLYAVNASSGALIWTFHTGGDTANANIYDNYLSITNSHGALFVLNPSTGALVNEENVGVDMGPGNIVFVGSNAIVWGSNGRIVSLPLSEIYPS